MKAFFIMISFCSLLFSNQQELFKLVKKDPLLHSGTHIVPMGDKTYFVSVGNATIRGTTPQAKITALKESRIMAQKTAMQFIHGSQITVDESMTRIKTVETNTHSNGKSTTQVSRTKYYTQIIKEQGDGILVNLKKLGKWKKGGKYFFAFFLEL